VKPWEIYRPVLCRCHVELGVPIRYNSSLLTEFFVFTTKPRNQSPTYYLSTQRNVDCIIGSACIVHSPHEKLTKCQNDRLFSATQVNNEIAYIFDESEVVARMLSWCRTSMPSKLTTSAPQSLTQFWHALQSFFRCNNSNRSTAYHYTTPCNETLTT